MPVAVRGTEKKGKRQSKGRARCQSERSRHVTHLELLTREHKDALSLDYLH